MAEPLLPDSPGSTGAPSPEPAAWAEVEAHWDEPAAHRAYLTRFADLDGLTTAGRRYREVLATRPEDAVALAMKAEIVKRATVVGLAMLPRTSPAPLEGRRWKRFALPALVGWLASALAWLLWKLFGGTVP